jgi:hypothetical protein
MRQHVVHRDPHAVWQRSCPRGVLGGIDPARTELAADDPELASLVAELEPMLQRLRLTGMCEQLDNLLEEAARHQMTLREALAWLCATEVTRKDQSRFEMAMRMARFPCVRTLEGFEFEAQPSIDPAQIRELASCRWIANGDNLVLLGPPGVGKTHLEVALGREAIRLGHSDPRSPAAPQPGDHHSWRQLPAQGEATIRLDPACGRFLFGRGW